MARKGIGAVGRQDTRPTCNPCQEGDHGRCATVLGEAYLQVTDSTFPCRCYYADEQDHKLACDERQQEHEDASMRRQTSRYVQNAFREYRNWAEEM